MQTFPIVTREGRITAFEVISVYIGPNAIVRLLATVDGVTDVRPRKLFGESPETHVQFKYRGEQYVVWEPYGDNSRYWIGPREPNDNVAEPADIEQAFKRYRSPLWRLVLGDILTLNIVRRIHGWLSPPPSSRTGC